MADTLNINMNNPSKKSNSFNCKDVDKINITYDSNMADKYKVSVSGSNVIIKTDKVTYKFTNIADPANIAFKVTTSGESVQFSDSLYALCNTYINWTPLKGTKVTGSNFNDNIDLSDSTYAPTSKKAIKNNTGLTINAGKGNDTLVGTKYNDVYTGGAGKNTIVFDSANGNFGDDTIKLTKGENLTVDLSTLGFTDAEDFRSALSVKGKNLVITLDGNETINLTNFAKSNIVGDNGSVTVLLKKANGVNPALTVDLNTDYLLELDENDANKKGVISGSRFADIIEGSTNVKSISGGAGNDLITSGKGNQTISGGAGADTFVFSNGHGVDTITDASKDDILKIEDNNITKADDLKFKKDGNNLEIYFGIGEVTENNPLGLDDENKIIIKNYFKTKEGNRIDKLVIGANEYKISEQRYIISGKKTITGTIYNDDIYGSTEADTIKANDGNDYIRSGAGDDKLYGGLGNNTLIFNAGDGSDTVYSNGGTDTLQFNNINSGDITVATDGTNYKLKYSDNDFVILDKYATNTENSVQYIQTKDGGLQTMAAFLSGKTVAITGSGKISGTDGADLIIGSAKADTINSLKGNDVIYAGDGNDTITAGIGSNRIVLEGENFGKDTINLTDGENLVIDMSSYQNLQASDIVSSLSGKNAVLSTANGTVTVKDIDVLGSNNTSVTLRLASGDLNLKDMVYTVKTTSSYEGSLYNEIINAASATKAITLSGGSGVDTIIAGRGKTTFLFNVGDGDDTIQNSKSNDIIQINAVNNGLSYEIAGDHLIIHYNENDSIKVQDYFSTQSKIDTLKIKNVHGEYATLSLKDELDNGDVTETVYVIDTESGSKTIASTDGYETLRFQLAGDPKYIHFNISTKEGHTDDLVVDYGNYYVTLTDYMKGGHSVKHFEVAGGGNSYDIPYRMGTNGNDAFTATETADYNEYFYLKGGNDTITFAGKDYVSATLGGVSINSDGTSANRTDILLNNYSLEDEQIDFNYFKNMGGYNKLEISFSKDDTLGSHHGGIVYENYFDNNKPTVQITDSKGATYTVDKMDSVQDLNWTTNAEKDKNHVAFLLAQGENTVVSNNKTNIIHTESTGGFTELDYTYKGGQDKVISESYADDEYTVENFNENTKLVIVDNDGADELNLGADSDSIRLFFDIRTNGEGQVVADTDTAFVSSGAFNVATLKEYLVNRGSDTWNAEGWIDGVVVTRFNDNSQDPVAKNHIETVTANGNDINLDNWKDAVADDVCAWFESKKAQITYSTMPTLSGAIEHGEITDQDLQELFALYNMSYSEAVPQPPAPEPTPDAENTFVLNYTNSSLDCTISDGDMVFTYWNPDTSQEDSQTIENYEESQYKFVQIDGDAFNINNIMLGTSGTDTIDAADALVSNNSSIIFSKDGNDSITSSEGNDYIFLGTGSDTIHLGEHFSMDNVYSNDSGTDNDTMIFDNHSLVNRTLTFENETASPDLKINGFNGDIVYYHDFFNGTTPTLTIQDANNDTFTIDSYTTAQNLDWSGSAVNKVAFIDTASDSTIVSGNNTAKANFIYIKGGGNLTYTYNGGIDTVNAISNESNDNYTVNNFCTTTNLSIIDNGGNNDILTLNSTEYSNLRLVFDVGLGEYSENELCNKTQLVHTDGLNTTTLINHFKGISNLSGIDMNVDQNYSCGFETIACSDINLSHSNIDTWRNTIIENVQGWLTQYGAGYTTVESTLNNNDNLTAEALTALVNCYTQYTP